MPPPPLAAAWWAWWGLSCRGCTGHTAWVGRELSWRLPTSTLQLIQCGEGAARAPTQCTELCRKGGSASTGTRLRLPPYPPHLLHLVTLAQAHRHRSPHSRPFPHPSACRPGKQGSHLRVIQLPKACWVVIIAQQLAVECRQLQGRLCRQRVAGQRSRKSAGLQQRWQVVSHQGRGRRKLQAARQRQLLGQAGWGPRMRSAVEEVVQLITQPGRWRAVAHRGPSKEVWKAQPGDVVCSIYPLGSPAYIP
jgi:hypothetical protein